MLENYSKVLLYTVETILIGYYRLRFDLIFTYKQTNIWFDRSLLCHTSSDCAVMTETTAISTNFYFQAPDLVSIQT